MRFINDIRMFERGRGPLHMLRCGPGLHPSVGGMTHEVRLLRVGIAPSTRPVSVNDRQQRLIGAHRLGFGFGGHDYHGLIGWWKEGLSCVLNRPVGQWIVEELELCVNRKQGRPGPVSRLR